MKKADPIYYVNGKFVPKHEAKISVGDLGLLRGYGVFDFLITYKGGKPFLINKHIKRLFTSANLIGLTIPYSEEYIAKIILKTIKKNQNGKEKALRIIVTGGESENSISIAKKPTIIITINDRKTYPSSFYKRGVKVITYKYNRQNPQAKSLNYIQAVKANVLAKKKGAVEAIYIDEDKVFEGTTSNLFLIKNNKIFTPNGDTLPGITRELVIKICKKFNDTVMREVSISELFSADELFLSASNKEILPVVKVDNKKIGKGVPGEITQRIIKEFRLFIDNGNW